MKNSTKQNDKNIKNNLTKKESTKIEKLDADNLEDFQRLVHLLKVHQVELEHQNEELRITQAELEESRNKYVNLFDFAPIPYLTLDSEGTILELNLSTSKMIGIERKKIIGRKFDSFIELYERDVFHKVIKSIFNSNIKQTSKIRIINKQKQEFYVLLEGIKLEDSLENDNNCQIALIDLTEYKRIENSLICTNEELRLLNDTKDKFFSIIAHDLRSPFQSLLGYSEMLATEIDTFSYGELKQFNKNLHTNLNSYYGLLENLLNWSIMQRDMLEFKPVNLDLNEIVNRILKIAEQIADKKNISLTSKIKPATLVYADVDMLNSIVQNLIINAIKFTKSGGDVTISVKSKNNIFEVYVKDNAIGIDLEKSAQLFNSNTLGSTNGTVGEKGTGLGLPLCKEFVEKNNGKIWVESELGKGSIFIFTLYKAI